MPGECKDKCCDGVCKGALPEFLKCDCARRLYLEAICKAEAKRCCCLRGQMKGLGMGLGLWIPEMCEKEELERLSKCCCECCGECKDKDKEKDKKKGEDGESCLAKTLMECPLVPQYIKDSPELLCLFSKEVIRQSAKQALKARCIMMSACCGKGCCSGCGCGCCGGAEECKEAKKHEHK